MCREVPELHAAGRELYARFCMLADLRGRWGYFRRYFLSCELACYCLRFCHARFALGLEFRGLGGVAGLAIISGQREVQWPAVIARAKRALQKGDGVGNAAGASHAFCDSQNRV